MNLNDLNNLEGLTHLTSKYTEYESILQNIREFESQKRNLICRWNMRGYWVSIGK